MSKLEREDPREKSSEIKFFFSPHGRKEDAEGFEEFIKSIDIVCIELVADKDTKDYISSLFNKCSQGLLTVENVLLLTKTYISSSWWEGLLDKIYNSQKRFVFLDLESTDNVFKKMKSYVNFNPAHQLKNLSFDEALFQISENARVYQKYQRAREAALVGRIKKLSVENKNKKIGVIMGSLHTQMAHDIRSSGFNTFVTFQSTPLSFAASTSLARSYYFYKKPSEKLIMYALLETLIQVSPVGDILKFHAGNTTDLFNLITKFLKTFSEDDIKYYFDLFQKDRNQFNLEIRKKYDQVIHAQNRR